MLKVSQLFVLGFVFSALSLVASPIPDFPFIAVTAEAEKSVKPDQATISFTILDHQVESSAAVDTVNQTLGNLAVELEKLGVKKDQITAGDLEKKAVRQRNDDRQDLKVLGYDVKRAVEVELSDLALYTDAASKIFKTNGVSRVKSFFGSSKKEDLQLELLSDACAKARKKAGILAKAAGVSLGAVQSVSDDSGKDFDFRLNVDQQFGIFDLAGRFDRGRRAGGRPAPIFIPKEISYESSVHLLFRLAENE